METLRMRCICLFAVTVMMIWGTAASKWCCMPAQWQGIEMMDIGTDTNCTPSITKMAMNISYDSTNKKIAVDMFVRTSSGLKIQQFVLQDFSTGTQYVVTGGHCEKMPISQSAFPMQCVPTNATVAFTSFVGGGAAKIATTTYHIVYPGVGEGFLTMTDTGCYPVTYEVSGNVQGVSFLQAVAIYGVTEGIKDPSIFNIPAVCKSKERTVHVKGQPVKTSLFGF